jgi:hypothetical protein
MVWEFWFNFGARDEHRNGQSDNHHFENIATLDGHCDLVGGVPSDWFNLSSIR